VAAASADADVGAWDVAACERQRKEKSAATPTSRITAAASIHIRRRR
jgi:hypothetical protein